MDIVSGVIIHVGVDIMKKKWLFLCLIILIILFGGGYAITRITLGFPSEPSFSTGYSSVSYTNEGLYFVKNNKLYFLDRENGEEAVVCNRANCQHDSSECYAYIDALSPGVMYYNGDIFVASTKSDIKFIDGKGIYSGNISLDCIKCDGSKKYNIYSADNGAVLTMKAIDDKLYFTAYKFHGEFDVDNYKYDQMLYEYDLRWKKLKEIKTFEADDSQTTSNLEIVDGSIDELYMTYELYSVNGRTTDLLKYSNNKISSVKKYENEDIAFLIDAKTQYAIRYYEEEDKQILYKSDNFFVSENECLEIDDAWIQIMDGYMHIINSDYKKILYDYYNEVFYVANTSFSEQGKYISDIYDIDRNNNSIFYNETDYTGIMPGTLFFEDTSKKAIGKLDEFINNNYVAMEDVSDEEMAKLSWISFSE